MKEKKNSDAKIQANNRYTAKAYDRINIAIPKGRKATVEAMAAERDKTVNGLINQLLQKESGLSPEEWKQTENKNQP